MRRLLAPIAALAALLLVAGPAAAVAPGWTHPLQVFAERFGPAHSMVLDAAGKVHIAVEGPLTGGIWYITNATGSWTTTQVTTQVDVEPSISLAGGFVYIAFVRQDPGTFQPKSLWTVTNATGPWVATKRHTGKDHNPSLVVSGGTYSLAFWTKGAGGGLKYLTNAGGPWSLSTIDVTCCAVGGPSLRLTAGGLARVAYPDGSTSSGTGLNLAKRSAGGVWSVDTVDFHSSQWPRLVINGDAKLVVVYLRKGVGTYVAAQSAGTWGQSLVGTGYLYPPDIAVWGSGVTASTAIIVGKLGILTIYTSGDIATHYDLVHTGMDSNGEIEQHGGKLRVIFNRSSGGTGDGIYYTKENLAAFRGAQGQ
jgi:hypothetical protein